MTSMSQQNILLIFFFFSSDNSVLKSLHMEKIGLTKAGGVAIAKALTR